MIGQQNNEFLSQPIKLVVSHRESFAPKIKFPLCAVQEYYGKYLLQTYLNIIA
jgi:hypothetical protein